MTDYSEEFDRRRRNRVELSHIKYGSARINFGGGREDCLEAFKRDKNTEHLVDAANYLMFRFMYPYPGEYFRATDSSESVKPVGIPINMEESI